MKQNKTSVPLGTLTVRAVSEPVVIHDHHNHQWVELVEVQ